MLSLLLLLLQLPPLPVGVEVFRSEKGLNANALYGVLVDPNGFVWVHSDNGLYRYDGHTFKVVPSTLGREVVLANFVDSTTIAAMSFDNSIQLIDIRRLSSSRILEIPDSLKLNSFASTVRRFGDTLYVGTSERRVLRQVGGKWENLVIPVTSHHFFHAARVALLEQSDSGVFVASSGGSWYIRENELHEDVDSVFVSGKPTWTLSAWWIPGKFEIHHFFGQGLNTFENYRKLGVNSFVNQLLWRSEDELWLATKEEGLLSIRNSDGVYERTTLLNHKEVSGLAMDSTGILWVSTLRDGLFRFQPWFDQFRMMENIGEVDLDRTLFSTERVVITEYNGVAWFQQNLAPPTRFSDPIHFANDALDGHVVIGQIDKAFLMDAEGRTFDLERAVRAAGYVIQHPIKASHSMGRWTAFAAANGVYFLNHETKSIESMMLGRATSIVILDSTRVAIGRPSRLDVMRKNSDKVYRSLPMRVTAMIPMDRNSILVGTNGDGLHLYDHVEAEAKMLLPGAWSSLHKIREDWIALVGAAGLFLLQIDSTGDVLQLVEVPFTDPGFARQIRHVRMDMNQRVWISTRDGLLSADFLALVKGAPRPRLRVSEVNVEGTYQIPQDTLRLSNRVERIAIALANQGIFNPNLLQLEYNISGAADTSWTPLSQPSIEVESIRNGITVFRFRLRNVLTDEVVSEVSLTVDKQPHWWERTSVIVLGILFAFAGTVGATLAAQRRIQRRRSDQLAQEDRMREFERIAVTRLLTSHYLFNALATIRSVARRSTDEVNAYIGRLSKVIRALIDRTSQNDVDLRSELDWIRDYVALESVGRQLPIEFHVDVDPLIDPEEIAIPAFILQPVVENAMFHGSMSHDPVIRCDIRHVGDRIHILIRNRIDSTIDSTPSKSAASRGLQFLAERLKGWGRYHGYEFEAEEVMTVRQTDTEWITELKLPFVNHEPPLVNPN